MNTKTVYLYDPMTSEYLGTYDAQESPIEPGCYIAPVHSTENSPPTTIQNQVAVYSAGTWSVQPDFRGQTIYEQSTDATQTVVAIGVIPVGWSLTQPPPSAAQLWIAYQAQAKAALDASDVTVLRCVEKGIAMPTEWATYRASLRSIVGASTVGDPTQPLPTKPAYPAGT